MNYKKAGELSTWLFVFSIASIGGTFFFQGTVQIILFFLGIALIVGGILVRVIFWRCPSCKKCPYCRADLNVSGDVAEPTGKKPKK